MKWTYEELNQSSNTTMGRLQKHVIDSLSNELNPDDHYNIYDWTADDEEKTVGTELSSHQVGEYILQFLDQFDCAKMQELSVNLKNNEVFIDLSVMDENDYEEDDEGMVEMDRQFHHIEVKWSEQFKSFIQSSHLTQEKVAAFNQLTDAEQWIVLNCQK